MMGEDASRVREGNAPQVVAALRNAVSFLISLVVPPRESSPEVLDRMATLPPRP
jgi:hypothetical protein